MRVDDGSGISHILWQKEGIASMVHPQVLVEQNNSEWTSRWSYRLWRGGVGICVVKIDVGAASFLSPLEKARTLVRANFSVCIAYLFYILNTWPSMLSSTKEKGWCHRRNVPTYCKFFYVSIIRAGRVIWSRKSERKAEVEWLTRNRELNWETSATVPLILSLE